MEALLEKYLELINSDEIINSIDWSVVTFTEQMTITRTCPFITDKTKEKIVEAWEKA